MPTTEQLAQVTTNANNLMDFYNHVHDFAQDNINGDYNRFLADATNDPGQQFLSTFLDSVFWSIGSLDFPGAGVIASFMGTFFSSYSGPNSPSSLQGTFASIWDRFSATFLQADHDLAAISANPAAFWDSTYTNPVNGKSVVVSSLGDSAVHVPESHTPDFQSMSEVALKTYQYNLAAELVRKLYWIVESVAYSGVGWGWSDEDMAKYGSQYIADNPAYFLRWRKVFKDRCGKRYYGIQYYNLSILTSGSMIDVASNDLCNWLFHDDGFGHTNPRGIAERASVFNDWGLKYFTSDAIITPKRAPEPLTASEQTDPEPAALAPEQAEMVKTWAAFFKSNGRQELEKRLIDRALTDPLFAIQLVNHPRKVIAMECGIEVPPFIDIEVIPEEPGVYKLVLPLATRASCKVTTQDGGSEEP